MIKDLDKPYGMAFWKNYLYVAEATSLKRYKFDAKALSAGPGEEIVSMKDYTKGHVTRTIAFDKKGEKLTSASARNRMPIRRSGKARRDLEVQPGRQQL